MVAVRGTFPAQCSAQGEHAAPVCCPHHAQCPSQPKQGRALQPLIPSLEGVCMCLPSKKAHALSTTFPPPPSSSICPFVHSISIQLFTVDTMGRIRAAFTNLLHFLSQPRSIQTQQKRICCLFPLVFICYPTEDKAPRLSNGRESLTPPKSRYIWTLHPAAKFQMNVL